ncbi:hypothetical protein I4U23_000995 [Adineta vaga]|nr:hypothetical protein I4U23_000995 [Adineta vaga]
MIYFFLIYLSLYLIISISGNPNRTSTQISANIEYLNETTLIVYYNLTANYSYYLTFRQFEHEHIKYGLFPATYRYEQRYVKIFNQSNTLEEFVQLFIICFHFLRQFNDIDIQCKDLRLLNTDQEHLPSYKPLFVPLMYVLSILMLLPMIMHRRHHKRAELIERRKQLRRLSLSIAPDNPDLLTQMVENGQFNFKNIPIQIELVSLPTTKTILDDIDDNDNVTFTLQERQRCTENTDDDEPGITADDCIAHLLDNTPWSSHRIQQSPMMSSIKRESRDVLREQQIPIITILSNDDDSDDKRPILRFDDHQTVDLYTANPTHEETDV